MILRIGTLFYASCPNETHLLKLGFTPGKAEQPLQGMDLQEKEAQKY